MSRNSSTLIDGAAVPAGTQNSPVALAMENTLTQAIIYAINEGASTDLEVTVSSSPDGVIDAPIQTLELNATTTLVAVLTLSVVPEYLIITANNKDGSNATTYSLIVTKIA